MTISFELRKLIYEKLSEGKHKDDITKTYNVSLRAMTFGNKELQVPILQNDRKRKGRQKNQF